jgi:glycosyltransferase involved in cell wall biosynthesis
MERDMISIVTPCYNEEDNITEIIVQIRQVMQSLPGYRYEHIFIDNASSDKTVDKLKSEAKIDNNIKIIVNSRNFGYIRSSMYGMYQATGDAIILIVADLQDPPEMIEEFVAKWKEGNDAVIGVKTTSDENKWMYKVRSTYYKMLSKMSENPTIEHFTGFGLYDKKVISAIKLINDPYPFFRGLLSEVGFKIYKVEYNQPSRTKGVTKYNFYTLYDIGILGIISNSKAPLRFAVFAGVAFSVFSALVGLGYFFVKIIYWDSMEVGIAPLIIMSSLMFSVMLLFMGILGEYIGAIYTQILDRPLAFEQERINFKK